jgi:SAM-dependent methyltransferase
MLYLSTHLGFEHLTGVDKFTHKESSYISNVKESNFYEADFNRFPMVPFIDDNTFDVVISSQTFEHLLNHPMGYLNEAWRILRYGGLLVFDVPNPCTLMKAVQVLQGNTISWGTREFARTAKLENGHIQPAWDVHYMEYSPSDIKSLLDDLKGSKVMHHKTVGTRPSDADSFLNRAIRWSLSKTGLMDQRLLGNVQCWAIRKETR